MLFTVSTPYYRFVYFQLMDSPGKSETSSTSGSEAGDDPNTQFVNGNNNNENEEEAEEDEEEEEEEDEMVCGSFLVDMR